MVKDLTIQSLPVEEELLDRWELLNEPMPGIEVWSKSEEKYLEQSYVEDEPVPGREEVWNKSVPD